MNHHPSTIGPDMQATVVPLASPHRDVARYEADLIEVTRRVIASGSYIGGPELDALEKALARAIGTEAATGVGSGTDALIFAMQAAGIARGDEVIVPSHTAGPSVAAINALSATPVFVDVEFDTACIDVNRVAAAIGPRTKAILAVHLYGHPARIEELVRLAADHGISLIEDCAQAQGARLMDRPVGSFGRFGCFSFYPTKNLGAIGDAGAVAGSTDGVSLVRQLRTYGWREPQFAEIPGGRCSRLDELQAGFLNVRLKGLDEDVRARREIARAYNERLAGLPIALPVEHKGAYHAYHLFVVKSDRRDALKEHLAKSGVMTGIHYPFPAHRQPGLTAGGRIEGTLDVTDRLQKQILSLPIFATMSGGEVDRVAEAVRRFFGN
ncbi:Daunorubicin biosynthesis sensory transduction protein DnrJ [Bradyrhizobium vignae]|uniref:Daunorubicin biosynthesis sensory transduction protein DnrJ n=2 Tax=Bradyrhizobium vignae TaxID=1549949 RepID=A0A2U3PYC3_9BRAD|nr:Daunorubicin biosynthesis sensory transduction protein DnrJ [Bradyrhizobium vignae]